MEKNGNEKTELKLQKKYTLSKNWNAYGPFFKKPVFLAAAFAFGCGFFLAAAFAFDCNLLRETPSSLIDWLIDWCLIWVCIENENENENEIMDWYENDWFIERLVDRLIDW